METSGEYPGRAETFIIGDTRHASEVGRSYWLSWRACEVWERPVVDRAYARLASWDEATVTVAGQ